MLARYLRDNPSLKNAGLLLMFQTGLRVGELSALRPENVNLKEMFIEITATETAYNNEHGKRVIDVQDEPKTEEGYRRVSIPDTAVQTLKTINRLNPFGQWLFMYDDGRRMHGKAFRDALFRACDKVGIPRRSPHKSRKTYASKLRENGLDDKSIQLQMGHKDISTTHKYYIYSTKRDNQRQKEISKIINF